MKKEKLLIIGLSLGCVLSGCGNVSKEKSQPTPTSTIIAGITDLNNEKQEENIPESETLPPSSEDTNIIVDESNMEEVKINDTIEASIINKKYAGEELTSKDFLIKLIKDDGTTITNPTGWKASTYKLKEGENEITINYCDCSTIIRYNAEKKPEPTIKPTPKPTVKPTAKPTAKPTSKPTAKPTTAPSKNDKVDPVKSVNPEAFAVSGSAVLTETEDMGQAYLDKIIFLGDSRTYSYKYYGVLSGGKKTKQVWTPKSGTMTLSAQGYVKIVYPDTGKEITIREAVKLKKPEYMVIGLGTNGVSYMKKETFKSEYKNLINDIKKISPDTKVIINSIYPVASYYPKPKSINNKKIAECNKWLVEIAEETGAKYLNTAEALVDKDGWCNIKYDNGGGATHLNKAGNEVVMRYIRTHGYK